MKPWILYALVLSTLSVTAPAGAGRMSPRLDGLRFTSTPATVVLLGAVYTYDADAVGGNPFDPIHYRAVSMPRDATIDSLTGEVRYAATSLGAFPFAIEAYLATDPQVNGLQSWTVTVTDSIGTPGACAVLAGTVTNGNGALVSGLVSVQPAGGMTQPDIVRPITNGAFAVPIAVEADYVVKVSGQTFDTEWYEDATSEATATPVPVHCGDSVHIDITVHTFATRTVTGRVYSTADGKDIPTAKVIATSANGGLFTATMNPAGGYMLTLPENLTYVLYAYDTYGQYRTVYYDGVYDRALATPLLVSGDLTGIDFALPPYPVYRNYIEGTVLDSTGTSGVSAIVKLYRIETTGQTENVVKADEMLTDSVGLGSFRFYSILPGEYILYAIPQSQEHIPGYYVKDAPAAADWHDATRFPVTQSGMQSGYDIRLLRTHPFTGGGIVRGTITARVHGILDGSIPLPEATAIVYDASARPCAYAISGADGVYEIRDVPVGSATLFGGMAGYLSETTSLQIPAFGAPLEESMELKTSDLTSVTEFPHGGEIAFRLYPNPAGDAVTTSLTAPAAGHATFSLYTVLGVRVRTVELAPGTRTVTIDLARLTPGMYYATLGTASGNATRLLHIVR